ncbi:MAG: hypothetical protein VB934_22760 [Polyangiaceae bacterium]
MSLMRVLGWEQVGSARLAVHQRHGQHGEHELTSQGRLGHLQSQLTGCDGLEGVNIMIATEQPSIRGLAAD